MQSTFFKPTDGWSGDYIPFYWDGKFRLFYLLDKYGPRGHIDGISWNLVETSDFVHFDPIGVMLPYGTEDEQDRCVYTGSVIRANDQFHIFYTGCNPLLKQKNLPEQKVMHAVSDDLHHWTKLPEHTFQAPVGYEPHDWRDPFVYWDDVANCYQMLLAARLTEGPVPRRGVTARLTSEDLIHWTVQEPLWAPESYLTHECPDLFKMGDWYYLIFSEFSDANRTRYVMSRSPEGPWHAPQNDVFDTRAYYAAKSWSDGEHRYLFGWIATRQKNNDFSAFRWAGSLAVHELIQLENGELVCREPQSIADSWKHTEHPAAFERSSLHCPYGSATAYAEENFPSKFRFEADISFEEGTHDFGLLIRADKEQDTAYALSFRPAENRVEFFMRPQLNYRDFHGEGMNRTFRMEAGKPFHLTVTADDTIMVAYIDNQIAFSARMYNLRGSRFGMYALHGGMEIHNARLSTGQQ